MVRSKLGSVKRRLGRLVRGTPPGKALVSDPRVVVPDLVPGLDLGTVEEVSPRQIVGALTIAGQAEPVRVRLLVNEIEVDRVDVPPGEEGGVAHFRFPIKDMWRFCHRTDRITVRVGDGCLGMPDGSLYYSPVADGRQSLAKLTKRLSAGEIFNAGGVLTIPKYLDAEWQRTATDLYWRVHDAVREVTGYETFLVYGSLLGAVREGRPLGHDLDFDAAYMSQHRDPALVMAEAGEVALALQAHGFPVVARASCIFVYNRERTQRIDLYFYSFTADGDVRLVLGAASDIPFRDEMWEGTEEVEFAGATVLIPRNAEALVTTLYGPTWRVPNPGFNWAAARVMRSSDCRFPAALRPIINWQDHWIHTANDSPSSFGQVVSAELRLGRVIDLGCGDARDAALFTQSGATVLGLDRAESAIKAAVARDLGPEVAEFRTCDFLEAGAVGAAMRESHVEGSPTLYYGRHVLDSISAGTQGQLLDEVIGLAVPGDSIALEFRGLQDDTLTAHEKGNCGRRVVDPEPVRSRLAEGGLEILRDEGSSEWESRGTKPIHLHRIVARKGLDQ